MSEVGYMSVFDDQTYILSPLHSEFSAVADDELYGQLNPKSKNEKFYNRFKRLIQDNKGFKTMTEAHQYAKQLNQETTDELNSNFTTTNLATLRYRIITLVGKFRMVTEDELLYKLQVMVSKNSPLYVSKRKFAQILDGMVSDGLLQVWRLESPTDNEKDCYVAFSLNESGGMVYSQFNYTDTRFIDAYGLIKVDQRVKKKYLCLAELIIQMSVELNMKQVRSDYMVNESKPNVKPEHLIELDFDGHTLCVLLDRLISSTNYVDHMDRQISKLYMLTDNGESPLNLHGDTQSPKLMFYSVGHIKMLNYIKENTQSLSFSPIPVVFLNEQEYVEKGLLESMYIIKDDKVTRFKL